MGHANPGGGSKPQSGPRVIPFGKYLLLDRIAVGGMAEVYTAKSFGIEGFEKIIATKRILPTMAEDQDFITMFIDEAKIAGHLTHANIVPIYELGKIGESHYIAMEYVWGKDLLQIMNRFRRMRRHMPPAMAAWIASKMLEGLDYAHRKRDRHGRPMGIIHRDVSPQNCLVSYEGQVKMIDFGIAKAASRNTKTQAGVLKGKFGYMSPEQVRGLPVDHRSDIFAASTCLHEMLTGERLFVGESDFSTLEKVRNADITPPSRMVADIPPELEAIVLKGLAREPDDRWQTAGEMQEELQRFIALSRPPFGTSKLNTWMRTAFAPEIAKEKARLDSFSNVSHPGMANPAAMPRVAVPQPAVPGPQSDVLETLDPLDAMSEFDEDDLQGESTMITASPFEAMLEAKEAGGPPMEELAEQATQIFFTADDLEEIQEEPGLSAPAPAGGLGRPVPPPPGGSLPAPVAAMPIVSAMPTPSPSVEVASQAPEAGGADMFAPPPQAPQRNLPTMEVERQGQLPGQATAIPEKKKGGMGKYIALIGLAAALVAGLTVALIFVLVPGVFGGGAADTGTISLRVAPEGADARVFVDGVQRGRAPLLLEHVPTGDRSIEIRADGYEPVTRTVPVAEGSTAMLEIAMTVSAGGPAIATAAPAPAVAAPTPVPAAAPEEPAAEGVEPTVEPTDEPIAEAPPEPASPEPAAEPDRPVVVAAANPRPRREPRPQAERTPRTTPRPRPTPRPEANRPRPTPRAAGGQGTLTINTIPWARVFVDGQDTGRNTPVRNLRVSPGRHTIGLRTNDGTMHTVPVTVEAGGEQRIVRRL